MWTEPPLAGSTLIASPAPCATSSLAPGLAVPTPTLPRRLRPAYCGAALESTATAPLLATLSWASRIGVRVLSHVSVLVPSGATAAISGF